MSPDPVDTPLRPPIPVLDDGPFRGRGPVPRCPARQRFCLHPRSGTQNVHRRDETSTSVRGQERRRDYGGRRTPGNTVPGCSIENRVPETLRELGCPDRPYPRNSIGPSCRASGEIGLPVPWGKAVSSEGTFCERVDGVSSGEDRRSAVWGEGFLDPCVDRVKGRRGLKSTW